MKLKSKEVLDEESPQLKLLPTEDYIAKIVSITQITQPNYNNPNLMEKVLNIEMLIYGLKSDDPFIDEDNEDVPPLKRRAWKMVNPKATGFTQEGKPSALRALIAYATFQNPEEELEIDKITDLIGKYIGIELITHTVTKGKNAGQKRNKVVSFKPISKSFKPNKEWEEQAMIDYEESKAKQSENQLVSESSQELEKPEEKEKSEKPEAVPIDDGKDNGKVEDEEKAKKETEEEEEINLDDIPF